MMMPSSRWQHIGCVAAHMLSCHADDTMRIFVRVTRGTRVVVPRTNVATIPGELSNDSGHEAPCEPGYTAGVAAWGAWRRGLDLIWPIPCLTLLQVPVLAPPSLSTASSPTPASATL